jgi:hypothetical protein
MLRIRSCRHIAYSSIFLVFLAITASVFNIWDRTCPADTLEFTVQQLQNPDLSEKKTYWVTHPRRILVIGMAATLEDVFRDKTISGIKNDVFDALYQLCSSIRTDLGDHIEISILYHQDKSSNHIYGDSNYFHSKLIKEWTAAGCFVTLMSQDILIQSSSLNPESIIKMTRFQRLAKLRSLHRSWILQRLKEEQSNFDAVLNIDFDILSLPRLSVINAAINQLIRDAGNLHKHHGQILCANGFEVWNLPFMSLFKLQRPHLFYDTFAAIDAKGDWYYPSYSCEILHIISLSQWTLFQKILFFPFCSGGTQRKTSYDETKSSFWPMQTCFGGAALYDWNSWSFPKCDYDAKEISVKERADNSDHFVTWKLAPKYTLSGTFDGDTCEHITFQQCLHRASNIIEDDGTPLLPRIDVAIMSNFVVEREASLLPTRAAKARIVKILLAVLMSALGICFAVIFFF